MASCATAPALMGLALPPSLSDGTSSIAASSSSPRCLPPKHNERQYGSKIRCFPKPGLLQKGDSYFSREETRPVIVSRDGGCFSGNLKRMGNGRGNSSFQLNATKKTFSSFDELLGSSEFILVDFYATWCGPCKLMSDVLENVSSKLKEKMDIKIVKIDTDKYSNLASKYFVQALPTVMLFKNGKPIDRFAILMVDTSDIENLMDPLLDKNDANIVIASFIANLAIKCVERQSKFRPTMEEVVLELRKFRQLYKQVREGNLSKLDDDEIQHVLRIKKQKLKSKYYFGVEGNLLTRLQDLPLIEGN